MTEELGDCAFCGSANVPIADTIEENGVVMKYCFYCDLSTVTHSVSNVKQVLPQMFNILEKRLRKVIKETK